MGAIAAAGSSAYNALSLLLNDGTPLSPIVDKNTSASKASQETSTAASTNNPTDVVDLTDRAKVVLARAKYEKAAADKLQAELDALKSKGSNAPDAKQASSGNRQTSFDDLAKIAASDDQVDKAPSDDVIPKVNFSNTVQIGGFTISAKGDANTWSSDIEITGPDGFWRTEKIFGAGEGYSRDYWSGGGYPGEQHPLYSLSGKKEDNKQYITVTTLKTAGVAVATDEVSESADAAQLQSTTFVIDFNTGSIFVQQTDASETEVSIGLK